jgi:uncharacterized cupredoxin-like copper-binding protein
MEVGQPGTAAEVDRTIAVRMYETEAGEYLYDPRDLAITAGETIQFDIVNEGENPHEFLLDTLAKNAQHMKLMAEFPEMEHDEPNGVKLEPGAKGSIIWTFANTGSFEFACLMPGHYEAGMSSPVTVNAPIALPDATLAEAVFTKGTIKKIDEKAGKVTIIHEELVDLEMPAMTMVFVLGDASMFAQLEVGKEIEFTAARANGKLTVTALR